MNYFIALTLIFSQILAIGQNHTERLNQLLQRKTELERSISYYQKELREVEEEMAQISQSQTQLQNQPIIVSESNEKIVATAGDDGAILRLSPSLNSPEVIAVPANATIYVAKEHQGLYFKATYYGKDGWINYTKIKSHPEIDALIKEPVKTDNGTVVLTVDENDEKYQRLLKIYGKDQAVKLMNNQLWKGMSHGQVRESIGKPISQTRENTPKGLQEEWTYSNKKLIFLNGSLLSW